MYKQLLQSFINSQIILSTNKVQILPLNLNCVDDLYKISTNKEIWKYLPFLENGIQNKAQIEKWAQDALEQKNIEQIRYPFLIQLKENKQAAGSMSYLNPSFKDLRIEIGWSWLGADFHGTFVNKHAKYLLLKYAFENLQMKRVELKTDFLNQKSRKAIQKIGCKEEGVLRHHLKVSDSRWRDSIYYSMLDSEWQKVKETIFKDVQ